MHKPQRLIKIKLVKQDKTLSNPSNTQVARLFSLIFNDNFFCLAGLLEFMVMILQAI